MRFLLDTHILIWWIEGGGRLAPEQRKVLREAREGIPLLISDISLWEVASLQELGRIHLARPLREWLETATAPPLVERCGLSPAVAAEVASLPPTFHRDPADRIIVATARIRGASVVTSDRRIIESKLVRTVPGR